MSRPYTDITTAISSKPIKNGSLITGTTVSGFYKTLNTYVINTPEINDIQQKFGNRFYNGIFVHVISE
jgi:hypothetical protein